MQRHLTTPELFAGPIGTLRFADQRLGRQDSKFPPSLTSVQRETLRADINGEIWCSDQMFQSCAERRHSPQSGLY